MAIKWEHARVEIRGKKREYYLAKNLPRGLYALVDHSSAYPVSSRLRPKKDGWFIKIAINGRRVYCFEGDGHPVDAKKRLRPFLKSLHRRLAKFLEEN